VNFFMILQILFDAVLLFGILFLFHFSVNQTQKKREEIDLIKDVQVQEMKENLQELLITLKQLGKEVSDNIQEQVREAEEKTETFKRAIQKLQKDLDKIKALGEEVDAEKNLLETKAKVIQSAKKNIPKWVPPIEKNDSISGIERLREDQNPSSIEHQKFITEPEGGIGYSSEVIKKVYRLADAEMGMNEIVRRTKLNRAEVQLILNLRGNRFSTPN
jgi:DNA repair exonuclease SbcCD ATPase subunit